MIVAETWVDLREKEKKGNKFREGIYEVYVVMKFCCNGRERSRDKLMEKCDWGKPVVLSCLIAEK